MLRFCMFCLSILQEYFFCYGKTTAERFKCYGYYCIDACPLHPGHSVAKELDRHIMD